MKLFLDTANLADIDDALGRGFVAGITTNPSLIAREGPHGYAAHIQAIIDLLHRRAAGKQLPLSVEVLGDPDQMLAQAKRFRRLFDYYNLVIKVPIGWDNLRVISEIRQAGGLVNVTCCMSYTQAMMAAAAGATYVSLLWCRMRDWATERLPIAVDRPMPERVVQDVHRTFLSGDVSAQIIAGSIRSPADVDGALQAGADIATVSPRILRLMCEHPKTTEMVGEFERDFANWSVSTADLDKVRLTATPGLP